VGCCNDKITLVTTLLHQSLPEPSRKDFHTTYHLLREDGSWRILSYTNHD
jgi:hypothetical protein